MTRTTALAPPARTAQPGRAPPRHPAAGRRAVPHRRPVGGWLAGAPAGHADLHEEDRYPASGRDLRLSTVTAPHLAGQIVTDGDRTVYASLFAR